MSDNQIDAGPIKAADLTYKLPEGATALIIEPEEGKPWRVVVTAADSAHILFEIPLVGANLARLKALPPAGEKIHPALKAYKTGEFVQVLVSGDWRDGKVAGSERGQSMLHVETEYGPVTVMAPLRIRKVAS